MGVEFKEGVDCIQYEDQEARIFFQCDFINSSHETKNKLHLMTTSSKLAGFRISP